MRRSPRSARGGDSAGAGPSRKRFLVVAGIFALSWILYIDRAAISSAKGAIASELGLSDQAMGMVFSAFVLGYALMQIPTGRLADRWGPRIALATMVALWSLFTFLTGTVSHSRRRFSSVRFLFGVAEAGAFPGSARAFYNWLPPGERGIANGILFSGAMIGGGVSFPICAWLLGMSGWRTAFYLLAIPGFLWAVLWLIFFRDHPARPVVQEASTSGAGMSFGQVFRSGPMALAMIQYFVGNFTFYIGVTWMLPYLTEHFTLSLDAGRELCHGAAHLWGHRELDGRLHRGRPLPLRASELVATAARHLRFSGGGLRHLLGVAGDQPAGGGGGVRRGDHRGGADDQPELGFLPGYRREEYGRRDRGDEHGREPGRVRELERVSVAEPADRQREHLLLHRGAAEPGGSGLLDMDETEGGAESREPVNCLFREQP